MLKALLLINSNSCFVFYLIVLVALARFRLWRRRRAPDSGVLRGMPFAIEEEGPRDRTNRHLISAGLSTTYHWLPRGEVHPLTAPREKYIRGTVIQFAERSRLETIMFTVRYFTGNWVLTRIYGCSRAFWVIVW